MMFIIHGNSQKKKKLALQWEAIGASPVCSVTSEEGALRLTPLSPLSPLPHRLAIFFLTRPVFS